MLILKLNQASDCVSIFKISLKASKFMLVFVSSARDVFY